MFSVVISYYNKKDYIGRCVSSVLNQTYHNYEIIIVDDGSTDNGLESIIALNDGRISVFQKPNGGVSSARNFGIAKASRDYIAFLDADDYWSPLYLETMKAVILREQNSILFGANYSRNKSEIETIKKPIIYDIQLGFFNRSTLNILYNSSTTIIKKSFFDDNPHWFDESLSRGEDLDLWMRAILFNNRPIFINNCLVYYSDEDENQITNTSNVFIEKSILNHINIKYKDFYKDNHTSFQQFISKFIYVKLWPYYMNNLSHEKAKLTLKSVPVKNRLYAWPYLLPKNMLQWLYQKQGFRRLLNKYYAACMRLEGLNTFKRQHTVESVILYDNKLSK